MFTKLIGGRGRIREGHLRNGDPSPLHPCLGEWIPPHAHCVRRRVSHQQVL